MEKSLESQWSNLLEELEDQGKVNSHDWLQAIDHVRKTQAGRQMSDEEISLLAKASPSVETFLNITREIFKVSRSHPHKRPGIEILLEHVDNSDYSLMDWVYSYEYLNKWLDQENKETDLLTKLGYLQCCAMSQESSDILRTLKSICHEMLENHGFELAKPKS